MFKFTEQVYNSNLPIKYVFEEGNSNKDHLLVVFSGFHNETNSYRYNYIKTLRNFDCNKLFILDNYGPRGSYYLGNEMNYEVETSVQSLISYMASKLNIVPSNIISAGTSKGGSAALYYGMKYNYGHIITGAPQTKIADYVRKFAKETAEYILGIEPTAYEVSYINNLIFKQIDKEHLPHISLLTSKNDIQYKHHIVPLINTFNDKGKKIDLTIDNTIMSHNEIAVSFPAFLLNKLVGIIHGLNIDNVDVKSEFNVLKVKADIDNANSRNLETSLVIMGQEGSYYEAPFRDELNIKMSDLKNIGSGKPEVVSIDLHITKGQEVISKYPLDKVIAGGGVLFKGTKFEIHNGEIQFEIDIEDSPDLEFAYYIRKDNKVIDRIKYNSSKKFNYLINDTGKYQIHYFISTHGEKLSNRTEEIEVERVNTTLVGV
ncbi:MAG: accessory Sec system protein Asp2 [Bacillota bacterium]